MTLPPLPSRRRLSLALAVPALTAALLSGCGAAEDLAQGAQDAAADKASEVAEDAASKAASKAADMAADTVRAQVCQLVEDGKVSAKDARQLEALVPAAEQAGVPKELVDLAQAVAEDGKSATKGKVNELKDQTCGATS